MPACSSTPRDFVQLGRNLFFSAKTPMTGYELWKLALDGASEFIGKASGPHSPVLQVTDPVIGGNIEVGVALKGVASQTPQALLYCFGVQSLKPYPTVLGAELYFSLVNFFINFPILTNGPTHSMKIAIPNDPAFTGVMLVAQCIVATSPNLESTPAARLYFGK